MMNEVGWQGDQVDAQQPECGPGHPATNFKAKASNAALEVEAPGDPDCEKGGSEEKGPKRSQTGRGPLMRGFPMGPDGRRTQDEEGDGQSRHPRMGGPIFPRGHTSSLAKSDSREVAASCDKRTGVSTGKGTEVIRMLSKAGDGLTGSRPPAAAGRDGWLWPSVSASV